MFESSGKIGQANGHVGVGDAVGVGHCERLEMEIFSILNTNCDSRWPSGPDIPLSHS